MYIFLFDIGSLVVRKLGLQILGSNPIKVIGDGQQEEHLVTIASVPQKAITL